MTTYVLFGSMTATSWVQITKAVLLMIGTVIISFLVLEKFNFNIFTMFSGMNMLTPLGEDYLNPGVKYKVPLDTIAMMAALMLGTAGLPHILMRFFTVKDAKTARSLVVMATWVVGIFYILTISLGSGAAAFVGSTEYYCC